MFLCCANDLGDRLLDADVDDLVAVVGQDDVHQVLADVVDVAPDRGQHDPGLRLTRGAIRVPLDERLEIGHGGLHDLSGLQHERQLHLTLAEQLANGPHPVEQVVVDDVESAVPLVERRLQVFLEALPLAVDDAPPQTLLQGQGSELVGTSLLQGCGVHPLEQLEQAAQRVVGQLALPRLTSPDALVVDEVEGHLTLLLGNASHRHDPGGVHDGRVESGFDALVQEHRVEDDPDGGLEPERHVRDAQSGLNVGIASLELTDGLNGLQTIATRLLLAGADREGQGVDDDVLDVHAPLTGERSDEPRSHGHLVLAGAGLTRLVDGQGDDGGAVFLDDRHDSGEARALTLTVLIVDRVDHCASAQQLEAGLDHVRLGRVEDQRKGAGRREPADDLLHVLHTVTTDVVDADVQQMGAVLGLVAGDLDALVPAGGQHRLLERLGTIGVRALAY